MKFFRDQKPTFLGALMFVAVAALISLVFVGLAGCAKLSEGVMLDDECEITCKECGFVHMKCENNKGRETETQQEGTISGPSTN
jgi:hypothetical protein